MDEKLSGCDGKTAFETYAVAQQVVRRPRERNPKSLQIYRCKFCRKFHLASAGGKAKRRGARKKRSL